MRLEWQFLSALTIKIDRYRYAKIKSNKLKWNLRSSNYTAFSMSNYNEVSIWDWDVFSLSFRLCIPQVRGQPHGFFFSSRLDPLRPLVWGSGWWGHVRWCLSISSSAFPDSDVHTLQLRGYAWRSGHLLVTGHVRTISVLTHVSCL